MNDIIKFMAELAINGKKIEDREKEIENLLSKIISNDYTENQWIEFIDTIKHHSYLTKEDFVSFFNRKYNNFFIERNINGEMHNISLGFLLVNRLNKHYV